MTQQSNKFNEKENILDLNSTVICKKETYIILNCVKNAIKVYEDDSENDLLEMDESDLEICKKFIKCFKKICIKLEKFINNNDESLKLNFDEIEAIQNAFEIYCIDINEEDTNKNHIETLTLYNKIKQINCEILNKINPKYIKMLNNFENTSLK